MAYRLYLKPKAEKNLNKLPRKDIYRIQIALAVIASDPFSGKKLDGDHKGEWSFRVWPYRIIYKIYRHELVILVISIGYRQGVYNKN